MSSRRQVPVDAARGRRPPVPHRSVAAADHRVGRRRPDRRRGRDPARPRRRVPAQHREPAAPVAEVLPPVRRRRHDARRRLPRRKGVLPQPVRPHRRASRPKTRPAAAVAGPGRARASRQARLRLGRAHVDEGRVEHRRHRAPRHRADQLLPVRRPVPGRPVHGRDTWARRTCNGGFPFDWGVSAHPKVDDAHRRAAVLQLQQAGAVHALRRGRRQQRPGAPTSTSRCPGRGCRTTWRSPRTTRSSTTFRCSGIPSCWRRNVHLPRLPPGHAVALRGHPAPRRTGRHPVVRGRPDLRAALHQRLRGRRRDRARRLLPGRSGTGRQPDGHRSGSKAFRFLALDRLQTRLHRWRFNLVTGADHRGATDRQHHRVRHDQLRLRRVATTATPTRRRASRAGSCSTGWSNTT